MKPDAPKSMQRRITAAIVVGRHHDDRHARILRAQIHQAGEAAHARHREVEQDEVDLGVRVEQLRTASSKVAGLDDFGTASAPATACASAPRNSGWSSAIRMRKDG